MARRRKRSELAVSLFPFISVLSCVIGTLTLMIAAAAIGEVAQDLEDEPRESISDAPLLRPEGLEAVGAQYLGERQSGLVQRGERPVAFRAK